MMSSYKFVFLVLLVVQPMMLAEELLYTAFVTPTETLEMMYNLVSYYPSWSKKLISFDAKNTSADYTTLTWMNPCYELFYAAKNATYVIFWLNGDIISCEAGSYVRRPVAQRYKISSLMRVERLGDRCAFYGGYI